MPNVIAFFDFDGTLTNKDSLLHFTRFSVGRFRFYLGLLLLSPLFVAFLIRILPNYTLKEKFITFFFKDMKYDEFQKKAKLYSGKKIGTILRASTMKKLRWHKDNGHLVVVVSASLENWLSDWCKENNVDLIATKLEVNSNRITGKLATKNCYGVEKVNRIKERYDLDCYELIYAYGNSKGDVEMFNIAHVVNKVN